MLLCELLLVLLLVRQERELEVESESENGRFVAVFRKVGWIEEGEEGKRDGEVENVGDRRHSVVKEGQVGHHILNVQSHDVTKRNERVDHRISKLGDVPPHLVSSAT